MNFNKSQYINPTETSNKKKHKHNAADKRKSDDFCFNIFLNKYKNAQKDKINKIPKNHRLSYQDRNLIISRLIINNNNDDKDKQNLINLLNDIYINDSHLSNKNIVKHTIKESSSYLNMLEKKKTLNFHKKRMSKDNSTHKSMSKKSKKKFSWNSNDNDNNNNNNKSNKKCSNNSNELNDKTNNFLSEKLLSYYDGNKGISKVKNNIDASNSKNIKISIKENEKSIDNLKEDKNKILDIKTLTIKDNESKKNNSKAKNSKNIEIEIKNNTKNIINIKKANIKSDKEINKKFKHCFFCCLTGKDDLLSDNE